VAHELFKCKKKNERGINEQRLIVIGTKEYKRLMESSNWEKVEEKEAKHARSSVRDTSATSGQTE
jgi:hypothetical protein